MIYEVLYMNKQGYKQDFEVDAESIAKAIENTMYFCQDCKRVIRCTPKPMFDD